MEDPYTPQFSGYKMNIPADSMIAQSFSSKTGLMMTASIPAITTYSYTKTLGVVMQQNNGMYCA